MGRVKAATLSNRKSRSLTGTVTRVSYALSSLIFIMSACVLIALSLSKPAILSDVKIRVIDMAMPAIQLVQSPIQKSIIFIRDISGLATLQGQNAALAEENIRLKEWYLRAKTLQSENAELKKMLNVEIQPQTHYITAETLMDASSPFAKSMLVKISSKTAIARNAAVMSPQGLVGRVVEVGDQTARVLMVTDMNSRIPVLINSDGETIHAVLAGQNDNRLKLLHVPSGTIIKPGATVITSGFGNMYPKGLPIGVVDQKAPQEQASYVRAYMDPAAMPYVKISATAPVKILGSQ